MKPVILSMDRLIDCHVHVCFMVVLKSRVDLEVKLYNTVTFGKVRSGLLEEYKLVFLSFCWIFLR